MSIGFKEWALVCEALGSGRQSLILRKGGIAEGREGFRFQHSEFLLFPTWFHAQLEKTTLPAETVLPEAMEEGLQLQYAVTVEWTRLITDPAKLEMLRDYHVLRDEVIRERFAYDEPQGLHVAFVRVFRVDPPILLRNEKKYGGCRSWVSLPETEGSVLVSVLSDEEHSRRREMLERLLV